MKFKFFEKIRLGLGLGAVLLVSLAGCAPINQLPIPVFVANPLEGYAELKVRFDASGSWDPDGSIVSYKWDFGDGVTAKGRNLSHIFTDDSDFNNDGVQEGFVVTLSVTDNLGSIARFSEIIEVYNPPPTVIFWWVPEIPQISEWVRFDASWSFDPAGIIPIPTGPKIITWFWDFGDGNWTEGPIVWHQYTQTGFFWVTLHLEDSDGDWKSQSQLIEVVAW